MKRFVVVLFFTVLTCVVCLTNFTAQANAYPDRPIDLIVPLPPGSAADAAGRLLADELGKVLGQTVVVVNKPGASLTVGTGLVARSKKDGYTLAYTATSGIIYARVTNPEMVHYNPDKDLEPLALHTFFPLAVPVQTSSPWKTFAEFIDYAKANPKKLRVGTHGTASIDHFNLEIIQAETSAQFTHVPFKGGDETTSAVLGGHVEAISHAFTKIIPHEEAGKLRILLVSRKIPQYPRFPTMADFGYKQGLLSAWFALYAPVGIPEDVKNVLVPAIKKAITNPGLTDKLTKMGFMVEYNPPAELMKIQKADYKQALAIAKKIGLRK